MGNPTRGELERTLALTEKANYSAVFSSGMASIFTIIQIQIKSKVKCHKY